MTDLIVLCYHAVSEQWPSELAVMPERLERQLTRLVARGYAGATFTTAVTTPLVQPTVVVTFDDAYRSVSELAAPILERLGLPGTVFVPTAFIGSEEPMSWEGIEEWRSTPWADELLPMSVAELHRLSHAGWEVGSHTHTHPRLTALGDTALRHELNRSRQLCEQLLGHRCDSLAYPFGAYDGRVAAAAGAAGYTAAGTLPRWLDRDPHPLTWPRLYIARRDDDRRFAAKISSVARRARSVAAWRR